MSSATARYMAEGNSREFRELVAFGLTIRTGLPAKPTAPRDRAELGDIIGLPRITILTRSARTLRFSEALDAADRLAGDHPDDDVLPLVVQRRQGRDLGSSYVVATLDTLGELLRRADS